MERHQRGTGSAGASGGNAAGTREAGRGGWLTTGSDTREPRPLAGPFLGFDIDEELERLRNEPEYAEHDRNAITLAKDGDLRIVLVSLRPDALIGDEEADGTVSVQVVEGTVNVDSRDETVDLTAGQLAIVAPGDPWLVSAREESAVLVTIGGFRSDL